MTTDQYKQQLSYVVATSTCPYSRRTAEYFLLNVHHSEAFSVLSGMESFFPEEHLEAYIKFLRELAGAQQALAALEAVRQEKDCG